MRYILALLMLLMATDAYAQRGHFMENDAAPLVKRNVMNCSDPVECSDTGTANQIAIGSNLIGITHIGTSAVGADELASDAVDLDALDACTGPNQIVEYTSSTPSCISTPVSGGASNVSVNAGGTITDAEFDDTASVTWGGTGEANIEATVVTGASSGVQAHSSVLDATTASYTTANATTLSTALQAEDNDLFNDGVAGIADAQLVIGITGNTVKYTTMGTGVETALENTTNANGGFVTADGTDTLTSWTLTTPTIVAAGWANANHTHADGTTGGLIPVDSLDSTVTQTELNNLSGTNSGDAEIGAGTAAMGTSEISANTCATVVTTSATGVATTDVIDAGFNTDPTGITGYGVSASDGLLIYAYPSTNNVNFKVCNGTGGAITPGALTLNWRVDR